jgi:hypothetical protein
MNERCASNNEVGGYGGGPWCWRYKSDTSHLQSTQTKEMNLQNSRNQKLLVCRWEKPEEAVRAHQVDREYLYSKTGLFHQTHQ